MRLNLLRGQCLYRKKLSEKKPKASQWPEPKVRHGERTSVSGNSLFAFSGPHVSYVRRIVRRTQGAGHQTVANRFRWLPATLLVCIVLPVCAFAITVAVVNPDDYKPQIIAAVQTATGRTLTLDGPLRISKSLWPTVEVSNVKLANLPGGTRPDMARAERIEAQLSLPALLWMRLEIIKLTLIGPNILFEEVAQKPNWEFTAEDDKTGAPATQAAGGFTLRFRNVYVKNGMVTFRLPARAKVVGIRALDFHRPRDNGPLEVSSELVYSDNQPFSLRASAQPTGRITDPWNTQFSFAAFDATATGRGVMNLGGDYALKVDGKAAALEKLNALLPEMRLPALHQLSFSTDLTNGPVRGDLPVIGKTHLHFGNADLGDRVRGLKLGAFDVALPAAGAMAKLSGGGTFKGQPFALDGAATVPEHLDGPASVPIDLAAQATEAGSGSQAAATAKGTLSLKGKLALVTGQFNGLSGSIALRAPALIMLRPMVSPTLPALTNVSLNGQIGIPADLASLTLQGASFSAQEGDITGDATIGLGSGLALSVGLRSSRLDMDALLTAFGLDATSSATSGSSGGNAAGAVFSAAPLPWSMLKGPTIDFKATIAATTFQKQSWRDVEFSLHLQDGVLKVDRFQLGLPQGQLIAALSADAATDTVPVSLAVHASSMPLAIITRYADLPGPTSGVMKVDASLQAAGRSPHDLAASLDGSFAAIMTGGTMSNAALIKLTSASLKALSIKVPAEGTTEIKCFGLLGSFDKGIGRFDTIALNSTYLTLNGVGQIDLGTETIALKLNPQAQLSGSAVSVPVLVEGPLQDVRGRLDAGGLDRLGLLIDAWFGGDQPQTCSDAGLVPPQVGVR